ncbi:MAG: response regulator [Deltaproteobacteria bacterium]|nr:response regulator [Deltaproteobacteria bacterium]
MHTKKTLQKILLVDDEETNVLILKEILENQYQIETAYSGEEALECVKTYKPDIVLLDIMMPGIDGYEVCQKMRRDETLFHTKIILVTAKGGLKDRLHGYEIGADDYVPKPFHEEELIAKVRVFDRLNTKEQEIKQLNRRLMMRQQDIPNMLWECDTDGCFTYVDSQVEQILGFNNSELIGKYFTDLLSDEDRTQGHIVLEGALKSETPKISGTSLRFLSKESDLVQLQIFADGLYGDHQSLLGLVGIFRNLSSLDHLTETISELKKNMLIQVDSQLRLSYVDVSIFPYINFKLDELPAPPDFIDFLTDPANVDFFKFSFDQKEDVPFPLEIKFVDSNNEEHHFSCQFKYKKEGPCLEGVLIAVSASDQLDLVSENVKKQSDKLKEQEKTLRSAVVVDNDMQKSILKDTQNLTSEILDILKTLEVYAFPVQGKFNLAEYQQFLYNRNLQIYTENLRLLGNKIHGLKGSCGFIIPEAKQLCHQMEEITRPLAEVKLVLTSIIANLIKQFIFKIEELLEEFQVNPEGQFSLENWLEKIEEELENGNQYITENLATFSALIASGSLDKGEIRNRKEEEYLSVSLQGYEILSGKVKDLFYSIADVLPKDKLAETSEIFNQFLNTHQQIKKVPLVLSRYERLIPKLAKDYDKAADFFFKDHQVKADREFWNAVHEIMNHVLKNAVIHGLETEAEREESGKETTGKITVELNEDATNILLSVADDGRGINVEKVKTKALENGILTADQLSKLKESEILDLLFIQGVSTAESLDDNAGRGVGMNAVEEAMRKFQGSCLIKNNPGKGCSWNFTFTKSSVSLPCVLIIIGDMTLAIPESYITSFIDYAADQIVTVKQQPCYRYEDSLIPLLSTESLFNYDTQNNANKNNSVIILENKKTKKSMVINGILDSAVLPISPLPKMYRNIPIYQGVAMYNNIPVQVVNVDKIF